MAWVAVIIFVVATLTGGAAIAYVTGAAAVLSFLAADQARHLAILPQRVLSQLDVFTFLAMPLFILAGEMMSRGGITRALIDLAMLIVGRFRGGLGHVNVATSIFMSSMSGSAVADAAATTSALVPEMSKRGYPLEYATALTAASSVLGPLIPPSVVMIFYGALMNVSVAALFAGGILPGLLVAAGLFAYNAYAAVRLDLPGGRDTQMPPVLPTVAKAVPALAVPAVMLGGIVFGLVTPTEAAALAVVIAGITGVVYALHQPGVATRQALRDYVSHLNAALERAALLTGAIFVILFAAAIFGYLVAIQNLPQQIAALIDGLGISGVGYLLLITVFFLIMGTFMDNMMAMVLLVPLLIPAAIAGGADPVHVGVVVCLNLTIGLVSPPVGGVLMVVSAMSGVSYLKLAWAILPLFLVLVVMLFVLVLFPEITLYIPRQAGFIQ
ncbi:TRAP transporter large permease [Aerobium aerolatum]|uniref:TRAP transporter large permease protein n=1 Tax=Aquamicrobium aerolatum DSM 21857 TaxID=1121003 RepID=A0A1I3RDN0_9HYPH|nr:TRAP transporter large permease [Aquamicrobium aerolatum]SFJ44703.1 TRAP transporter, DctM subunit [Aquamicrobium aerolatum DSM 21857]